MPEAARPRPDEVLTREVASHGDAQGPNRSGDHIAQRLSLLSDAALRLQEGTIYPALYRMEAKGWVASEWAVSDNNRRAKYYRLTRVGRKQLDAQQETWDRLTTVVAHVL